MKRLSLLPLVFLACQAPDEATPATPAMPATPLVAGPNAPADSAAKAPSAATPAVPGAAARAVPATPLVAPGGETPVAAAPDTPRVAEVKALQRTVDEALAAWSKASRESGADEAARKAWLEANPRPTNEAARAKLLELVQAEPKDDASWLALAWLARQTQDADMARDLLLEHFATDERMADEIATLGRSSPGLLRATLDSSGKPTSEARELDRGWARLQQLLARSPHKRVKALVEWELAERTRREHEAGQGVALADVLARYERIAADYGDVARGRRLLKDSSEMAIRNLTVLAVGQPAPEIAGEDLDGVAFKLSDYRGKVVMLDFWGDW